MVDKINTRSKRQKTQHEPDAIVEPVVSVEPAKVDNWTQESAGLLIEKVQSFEALWNKKDPEYLNTAKKCSIWDAVAAELKELNKTGEQCKMKWKGLMDQFRVNVGKQTVKASGAAATSEPQWWAYRKMEFAKGQLDLNKGKGNIPSSSHSTSESTVETVGASGSPPDDTTGSPIVTEVRKTNPTTPRSGPRGLALAEAAKKEIMALASGLRSKLDSLDEPAVATGESEFGNLIAKRIEDFPEWSRENAKWCVRVALNNFENTLMPRPPQPQNTNNDVVPSQLFSDGELKSL